MDLIFSPSEFVDVFNQSIDYAFPSIVVEGELSNFRVSKNRWVYFDIKDDSATVKCFGTIYMLPGPLEDGMMVRIVCSPRLHPQFNFSLNVQSITPVGEGQLAKAAELLFKKLEAEGLFAPERKRSVPYPPENICVITSLGSAAHADFMKISKARWPAMEADVLDSLVQGTDAPGQIARRVEEANASGTSYDALVVIRGGGSAEDLAAFSDERVVRALAASRIPTCVAIGHEVDESLAELVCDMRASTPSNLAELLVPDRVAEQEWLNAHRTRAALVLGTVVYRAKEQLEAARVHVAREIELLIQLEKGALKSMSEKLELLNPKAVLRRGYALVRGTDGSLMTTGSTLNKGDEVAIMFKDITKRAEIL